MERIPLTEPDDEVRESLEDKQKPLALCVEGRTLAVSLAVDLSALFNAVERKALRPKELWRRGLHLWELAAEADWLKLPYVIHKRSLWSPWHSCRRCCH